MQSYKSNYKSNLNLKIIFENKFKNFELFLINFKNLVNYTFKA